MKIRNGFVSNSSSSSFVVAFLKKPESIEDVMEILFGDRESDGMVTYYDHSYPQRRVAEQVFSDLQSEPVDKDQAIIDEFNADRYNYNHKGMNTLAGIIGGQILLKKEHWGSSGKYWGHNEKTMKDIMVLEAKHEKREKELDEKDKEFQKKFADQVGYPCPESSDEKTVKKWYKKKNDIAEKDEEYKEFRKNRYQNDSYWEEISKLQLICAEADTAYFLEQNDGCFIGVFHYADEDGGFFCTMEHGDIFNKLEHMRVSKH